MLGGAADTVRLDGSREFETHPHRFGHLGRPTELVALHLAIADGGIVIGIGHGSRQHRPLDLEIEHARFVAHRGLDRDVPPALYHGSYLRRPVEADVGDCPSMMGRSFPAANSTKSDTAVGIC